MRAMCCASSRRRATPTAARPPPRPARRRRRSRTSRWLFNTSASISGTAQEGQTLTAAKGTLNDSDAAITGYQWTSNGVNISERHQFRPMWCRRAMRAMCCASSRRQATPTAARPRPDQRAPTGGAVTDITLAFTSGGLDQRHAAGRLRADGDERHAQRQRRLGYRLSVVLLERATRCSAPTRPTRLRLSDRGSTITLVETATDSEGGETQTTTSTSTAVGPVTPKKTTSGRPPEHHFRAARQTRRNSPCRRR